MKVFLFNDIIEVQSERESLTVRKLLVVFLFPLMLLPLLACSDNEDTASPVSITPTESADEPEAVLDYKVGDTWEFAYYDSGTKYGSNTYEVVRMGTPAGRTVYIIESHLKLESSSACKPTQFDTTYHVASDGSPVKLNMSGKIGKG
jgi:hypothetical protein